MKQILLFLLLGAFLPLLAQPKIDVKKEFELAAMQYEKMLAAHPNTEWQPFTSKPDGTLKDAKSDWWTSGFFGGSLWYLYEFTKDSKWKDAAHEWSMAIEKEQHNTGTHDLGFMLYCPFGNGLRLTNNNVYKDIMLTGAQSLATRFDPKVGVIKSWNRFQNFDYPVIVDNMMNLEFLFWASKVSGDKRYYDISVTHADKTITNHYRPDGSSYHVVCYDNNGNVIAKKTAQGAADESAWARGNAWGLYGYTVMYRETKDKKYLQQAQKAANFWIHHPNLPSDKIPYWDFNAPNLPNEERDASAAAITASALFELSKYSKGKLKKQYLQTAIQTLESLCGEAYRAKLNENNNFLIKHCVGHKPAKSEIDVPLVYADYYFLEALLRYDALKKKS
ncbi:MAG: glycoside hydrolase family 88 protein [Saprospiraceae bacterium]|nr:glycoside hydrolase family 88 protein [Saprospiraceae bacterium]